MKNIESILTELGISIPEDKKDALNKAVSENYKTIAEFEKKDAKIQTLTEKVQATEEALKAFDGIDAEGMKKQIADLTKNLADKDKEYQTKLADRDFEDILKGEISGAKGKNAKAIMALLDIDALKASKNQKEDVAKALKTLSEAEDSKMLFGEAEQPRTVGNPIGTFNRQTNTSKTLDDIYKGNPFYHSNGH